MGHESNLLVLIIGGVHPPSFSDKMNHYYVVGSFFYLIALILYVESSIETFPILPFALGTSIIYKGFTLRKKMSSPEIERDRLMASSFVCPGLVQAVLMKKKVLGSSMLIVFYSCAVLFYMLSTGVIDPSLIGDRGVVAGLVFGILIVFFIIVLSSFQITEYCNERELPFADGEFELEMTNGLLARRVLYSCAGTISAIVFVLILIFY